MTKLSVDDLPPDQLRKLGLKLPRRHGFPKDEVRSWSLRVLALMAELTQPHWKKQGVRQPKQASRFLLEYPWSSYSDYVDQPRYPSLLSTALIRRMFRTPQEYARYVESWRRHDFRSIKALTIEAPPR